jgi:hypothetical protein
VARQIQNKLDLPLLKLGRGELKHIHLAMAIYRIVLPWEKKRLAVLERWAFALRRPRTRRWISGAGAMGLVVLFALAGLSSWQRMAEQHRDAGMGRHARAHPGRCHQRRPRAPGARQAPHRGVALCESECRPRQ